MVASARRLAAAIFAVGLVTGSVADAAPRYRVIPLQDFGTTTLARDLNDSGISVGIASGFGGDTAFRAVRWLPDGTIQLLGLGANSQAYAINGPGQIAGSHSTALVFFGEAALWDAGTITDLGVLAGGSRSEAFDLNDAGVIVGFSENAQGKARAVRFDNPGVTDLGSIAPVEPLGGAESAADAVNDRSEIVGFGSVGAQTGGGCTQPTSTDCRAMLHDGVMRNLELLGLTLGGLQSRALNINDAGAIVAWEADASSEPQGILFENGVATPLGTLGGPSSVPWDINEKNVVVGFSKINVASERGFVWVGGVMHDVNDLVDPEDPLAGTFTALEARGVNESGQIIVNGLGDGIRSWLLTPLFGGRGFKCYDAKTVPGTPEFTPRVVALTDPFGATVARAMLPHQLCTPVGAQEAVDPQAHLMCYKLVDVLGAVRPRERLDLRLFDEYFPADAPGGEGVGVLTPGQTLCLPAIVDGDGSLAAISAGLNHFQCYEAEGAAAPGTQVVDDAFFPDGETLDVGPAQEACMPVDRDGLDTTPEDDAHLKCYELPQGDALLHTVDVEDAFGALAVRVGGRSRLCTVATSDLLGPGTSPSCGLLGIEAATLLGLIGAARRARRRGPGSR